ncbi:MAG TPA: hypothetical protein VI997_02475 [Candidatus Thermoplasmatota archaeon]|nr:hypothetical protein [Candidatus Thermoplasmatota archaeon]
MPETAATAGIAFTTVVAAALAAIMLVAWRRDRRPRFAFLAGAFAVFLFKGLVLSWALWSGRDPVTLLTWGAAFDAAFLAVLYLALAKR